MTASKPGRIVTFYSYKGGTGRSMALANIAWILASNSKRVLVVDWDLEAPGLQRYFRPFLIDRELATSLGVVDLISAFILEAITPLEEGQKLDPDWFLPLTDIEPYVISLDWEFPKGGLIDFIPAGRQGFDYAMRFAAINWQKFYDVLGGGKFIEVLKATMRAQYDYILVDSRTGVSDTSGICTLQMPDSLVVCFTYNNQSIEGAASITQGVFEQRATQDSKASLSSPQPKESSSQQTSSQYYQSPYRLKIFPVPMRVDQSERDKLDVRKEYARRKFDPFIQRLTIPEREDFWGGVAVPYVPYFAYEEMLATFKDNPADRYSCLAAFTRIAMEIAPKDVTGFPSLISPKQKDDVLREFARTPMPDADDSALSQRDGKGIATGVETIITTLGTVTTATKESQLESSIRIAEATLQSLDDEERDEARLMWMRLVRVPGPGENTENSKVRVHLSDLRPAATPIIERFSAANIISVTQGDETEGATIEVINEELVRSWPTLGDWIKADRDLMVWRQSLQISKARWEERGRPSLFLLTGRPLAEAIEWDQTHRRYLSQGEAGYIEASIQADVIRQKGERFGRLRKNVGVAAILVLTVLVLVLVFVVSNKNDVANKIATEGQQRIDAYTSGAQGSSDQFQLGILLATEAQRYAQNAKAEGILKKYLGQLPRNRASIDVGGNVLAVVINPDASRILSVTGGYFSNNKTLLEDRAAQVHDIQSGRLLIRVPFKQGSERFLLSPDSRYLAIVLDQNGTYLVEILEAATGATVATVKHILPVSDMAFSPDGLYFATASVDHTAQIVALGAAAKGAPPVVLRYTGTVEAVTFSGDSRYLAVSGEDFKVHVWQITPDRPSWPASKDIPVAGTAFLIALNKTGNYLVTLSFNSNSVIVWDVANVKKVRTLDIGSYGASSVSFSQDDRFIVVAPAFGGSSVSVWQLDGGAPVELRAKGDINLVSFSPDGNYLAVAAANNAPAQVWRYRPYLEPSFEDDATLFPQFAFTSLTFGSGNLLVTAGGDNVVRIWELGVAPSEALTSEACARLTRNLTIEEWNTHLASHLGAYRRTCSNIP